MIIHERGRQILIREAWDKQQINDYTRERYTILIREAWVSNKLTIMHESGVHLRTRGAWDTQQINDYAREWYTHID